MRLTDVITSVAELRQRRLETEDIELRVEDVSRQHVLAVLTELQQVVLNFVVNAEQAIVMSGRQPGRITVRTRDERDRVILEVEDTGPGIAPGDLPKLFQKFSQLGARRQGAPRGTGLGLVVCKELTELHRGTIHVCSVLGQGTSFTVDLPIYTETLALQEGLRQLSKEASEERQPVAFIAIRVGEPSLIEPAVNEVRAHAHRDDLVVGKPPGWVVVLAVTDAEGVRAMARRLHDVLPDGNRLTIGATLFAGGEPDVERLLEQAMSPGGIALVSQGSRSAASQEPRPS